MDMMAIEVVMVVVNPTNIMMEENVHGHIEMHQSTVFIIINNIQLQV